MAQPTIDLLPDVPDQGGLLGAPGRPAWGKGLAEPAGDADEASDGKRAGPLMGRLTGW